MLAIIILILFLQVCLAQYSIDISNPFLLTNSFTNIITVSLDQENSYLVSFQGGQALKYSSDFTSFTALSVPQTVQKFNPESLNLSISLSDGKNLTMLSDMTTTLSNNLNTLRAYTYPDFYQIHFVTFTEPILDYQGIPIQFTTINPLHILVFNSTTKVIYDDIITTAFNVNQTFGNGSYNTAVAFKQCVISNSMDMVQFTFVYYQAVYALGLVQVNIIIIFKYNSISSTFALSVSSNYSIAKPFSMEIQSIRISNGIVLMQLYSFSLLLYVQNVNLDQYQCPYINKDSILDFFYIDNIYYILFTNGLITASIDEVKGIFMSSTLINTLPYNIYQLIFGVNLDILFVPGAPYLYKAKCLNQTQYLAGKCVSYNCTVANCNLCSLTSNTCETCVDGFTRTDSFTCIDATTTNSMMSNSLFSINGQGSFATNSATSLTSNATSLTSNATSLTSSATSLTSSATSLTSNTTNTSSFPSQTNFTNNLTNSSTNYTNFSNMSPNQVSTFDSIFPFLQQFQSLYLSILNGTKKMISIPSLRRVSPTFYFFANFDDLYLYCFHDRLYGNVMSDLFNQLNNIQSEKWSMFSYGSELVFLGFSNSSFYSQIDYQKAYIIFSFNTPDHPDLGSEAILINCTNFFLVAIPLIILSFIVFRIVFSLLFRYPVSQLFRKFDIWGCLFITLFDGNIQQFTFYSTSEWKNTFFFSVGDKCIKTFTVFFGFILVIISIGGFLVAFGLYGKLNKYLVDNNKNNLKGVFFILLQYGLRNFIFGILHSILRSLPYPTMIVILLSTELLFALLFVLSFTLKIYKMASFMWFYVLITFIRILLIFTLAIDYEHINFDIIESLQCTLLVLMLFVYLLATLAVILVLSVEIVSNLVKLFKNKPIEQLALDDTNQMNCQINTSTITKRTRNIKYFRKSKSGKIYIKKSRSQGLFTFKGVVMKIVEVEEGIMQISKTKAQV